MKLHTAINQYVKYRQSLGARFRSNRMLLNSFVCAMGTRINLADVKSESVSKYLAGTTPTITTYWHAKHQALNGFYRYALSRGHISTSPLPIAKPKRPPGFVPYIYNVKEMRSLLDACTNYQSKGLLEAYTIRAILLVLYGAGLRIGEAISLTLADVDLSQELLTIRETKFYKTRFVPLGKQLTQILFQYIGQRQRKKHPQNPEAPFFVGRTGKPISRNAAEVAFRVIREKARIRRTDGARYQPRLHDLRHSFAVHRLTAWYKEGCDVQRLLPVLSVYLGHAKMASTSTYLTMTPMLLEEAGRRFEQYAFKEVVHD